VVTERRRSAAEEQPSRSPRLERAKRADQTELASNQNTPPRPPEPTSPEASRPTDRPPKCPEHIVVRRAHPPCAHQTHHSTPWSASMCTRNTPLHFVERLHVFAQHATPHLGVPPSVKTTCHSTNGSDLECVCWRSLHIISCL